MAPGADLTDLFHDSLTRCQNDPDFFEAFYSAFIHSSPEVAAKFTHVDMHKQHHMLQASFYMVMLASQGQEAAQLYLDKVAEKHSRTGFDIRPELYELWLASLLATVAATDPRWNPALETAWREMMAYGIRYMQSRY